MNIKETLKTIKLNESLISMILGGIIVIVVAILVFNYFNSKNKGQIIPAIQTENTAIDQQEKPEIGKLYIVKKGESLWSIAEEAYGTGYEWKKIAEANNISLGNKLSQGQELLIPENINISVEQPNIPTKEPILQNEIFLTPTPEPTGGPQIIAEVDTTTNQVTIKSGKSETKPALLDNTEANKESEGINKPDVTPIAEDTYTVVHGDTLWDIAVRAYGDGYRWVEIAQANNLENPDLIHSGNVFIIPR